MLDRSKKILTCLFLGSSHLAVATTYPLPENSLDGVVGDTAERVTITNAKQEDTLLDIARRFDIGQNEILRANPKVDRWMPGEGAKVKLPNSRILPDTPRKGLVLNLPEYRIYYYPTDKKNEPQSVTTNPISIGRLDWNTPLGETKIIAKTKNPTWTPPQSIKDEHAAKGEILPNVVPAGPDNPLGLFALRLGIPGYLIHSTNKPYGVGMRVSHGCIRMYPEDIESLFPEISIGEPVYIVNQPIKVGWLKDTLYIEIHPDLEGEEPGDEELLDRVLDLIIKANNNQFPVLNGAALNGALKLRDGIPVAIFQRPQGLPYLDIVQKKVR